VVNYEKKNGPKIPWGHGRGMTVASIGATNKANYKKKVGGGLRKFCKPYTGLGPAKEFGGMAPNWRKTHQVPGVREMGNKNRIWNFGRRYLRGRGANPGG